MAEISKTSVGNGGWVRLGLDGSDAFVLIRFTPDGKDQLRVAEAYLDGRVTGELLRALRIGELEGWANHPDTRPTIEGRLSIPGPDLRRLASHYAATFGDKVDHWVARSMRAQMASTSEAQAPMGRVPKANPRTTGAADVKLELPASRPYPDDFYERVAQAYWVFLAEGEPPGKSIAALIGDGFPVTTVHRWIRRARTLGYLPEGTPGRAG